MAPRQCTVECFSVLRIPTFNNKWPDDWKISFQYDLEEVFGGVTCRGYAYAYERRASHTLSLVAMVAAPGARVLDVAAAQGNFSLRLAEAGYRVTWNDLRGGLKGYVELKYENGEIEFAPGNAFDLGLEGCFDVVLITEIIEHLAHPDEFLIKIARLVRRGGHVVMTTPNGGYFINNLPKFSECSNPSQYESVQFKPNSDGHIFLLHEDEVPFLAQRAGLAVKEVRIFSNILTNGHLKTEALLKVIPSAVIRKLEDITVQFPRFLKRRLHTGMAVLLQRP